MEATLAVSVRPVDYPEVIARLRRQVPLAVPATFLGVVAHPDATGMTTSFFPRSGFSNAGSGK
jgi:hypothetical protein